jgi:hypothetical protein
VPTPRPPDPDPDNEQFAQIRQLAPWLPEPAEDGLWGSKEVAAATGRTLATYNKWRGERKEAVEAGTDPNDPGLLPRHRAGTEGKGGRLRYRPLEIVRWGQQTGKIDLSYRPQPVHVGGRPKGSRKPGAKPNSQPRDGQQRWRPTTAAEQATAQVGKPTTG